MKIIHKPEFDYVSIDFKDEIEAKSYFEEGVIVRLDKKNNIIGIDITDSSKFFLGSEKLGLKEAAKLINVSESTLRRMIKKHKIKYERPNGKDYKFLKTELLKLVA